METIEKIKKVNPIFALLYICLPTVIMTIVMIISSAIYDNRDTEGFITCIMFVFIALWYTVLKRKFYKSKIKRLETELDGMGFTRDYTFYGKYTTAIVDIERGKVAVIFFWNPFKKYIVPAYMVDEAWVDDGKHGSGKFASSGRVRFCFILDGVRINVDTFTSNRSYLMTDEKILEGITKANRVVEALNVAKNNAKIIARANFD